MSLMTYKEAAEYTHYSVNTLRQYKSMGMISCHKSKGHRVMFDTVDLDAFLSSEYYPSKKSLSEIADGIMERKSFGYTPTGIKLCELLPV